MQQLAEMTGRNIHLDPKGLEEQYLTDKAPVTLKLDRASLSSALTLALEPLSLGYRVEESGAIVVTSMLRLYSEQVAVTYSVADLVMPIPKRLAVECGDAKKQAAQPKGHSKSIIVYRTPREILERQPQSDEFLKETQLRFKELIDLITATCEPNSWAEVGGSGQIKANDSTLSLVVRQTRAAHAQIKDLFEQLRRLQNLQASLQVETLTVPQEFWSQVGRDFDIVSAETFLNPQPPSKAAIAPRGVARLTKKEAALLRGVSRPVSAPKVTLFNGQELDLFFGSEPTDLRLALKSIVSADRKQLRMQYATQQRDAVIDFATQKLPAVTFADGQSLLIDVTDIYSLGPTAGVPILTKDPGEDRLFKNTGKSDRRTLLLITGQVVVAEEEQAKFPEVKTDSSPVSLAE